MSAPYRSRLQARMEEAKHMKEEEKQYRYNGILYPTIMCPPENLKALESMEAREDDVMLVAYPKCGFNWMVGVMRKIMAAAAGKTEESKMPPIIEFFTPEMQKVLSEAPSPRFLGTHLHPTNIPGSFTAKKSKMLVVFRNPKDTAVSFYHFSNKNPGLPTPESWDKFYSEFMSGDVIWGSYFDHALAWEKRINDPDVMIVTYEYLKENLSEGVRQVSKFFNFTLSEEQILTIARDSTFNAMKESSKGSHGQMSDVFFRKGEVGDWKNHFSEAQSKEMDDEFEKRLAGTKLAAKLKYNLYCK
ncbi:sulfotransferase 6B1-like [Megalops cyprinoides]|uniref:sulfotransferase 6B1-like n=1 Tax=Megalops cyprinoides TaxID=118141 RepID=UPI00186412F0|nr:sulfotransferase 6B1-like [Megalops cyprinoides]